MSEIATRKLPASARSKRAISEHAQEHARALARRFLTYLLIAFNDSTNLDNKILDFMGRKSRYKIVRVLIEYFEKKILSKIIS